jgi:hypothetical protein
MDYTLEQWTRENDHLKAGGAPEPCPRCKRRGFYAPRGADGDRHYRACKFCGLWQDVGRPEHTIIRYECFGTGHCVADWKEPHESWACPICGAAFTPSTAVSWPEAVPNHYWNEAPVAGSQDQYKAFWASKGMVPPPFGIP